MVEQKLAKPRRRYINIPESGSPKEDTARTFQIQGRAVGPHRETRIGQVAIRGVNQVVRQPRRSDVVVGFRPVTGDNVAISFRQDGIFPHEDDVSAFPRKRVIFAGHGNEIAAARKRRTTRAQLRIPLGKGAVPGTPKTRPVIETGPGAVPGFRMPSKLRPRTDRQR